MGSVNELLALIAHRTLTSRGDEKLCVSYVLARPLTLSPNRLLPTTPPLTVTARQRHERPAASSISHVDWHSADRRPGRPLPQPALSNGSGSAVHRLDFLTTIVARRTPRRSATSRLSERKADSGNDGIPESLFRFVVDQFHAMNRSERTVGEIAPTVVNPPFP